LQILNKLKKINTLEEYIQYNKEIKSLINNGLQIVGKEQLINEFNISEKKLNSLNKIERKGLRSVSKENIFSL